MTDMECTACHLELPPDVQGQPHVPCPHCGSVARLYKHTMSGGIRISGSATVRVVSYPDRLLETATRPMKEGEFGIAVVVACMAAETASSRRLDRLFASGGIEQVSETVRELLPSASLSNERVRGLGSSGN